MSYASVIKKLEQIANAQEIINYNFIDESLKWIANTANTNLDNNCNGYEFTNAREWTRIVSSNIGTLTNDFPNSAAIEFGIGLTGSTSPTNAALENNYQYNVPSEYKDDEGNWTFYEPNLHIYIRFNGYVGKSFLWKALSSYITLNMYQKIYKKCFDEELRRICK